jgi:response regulator of citrate/malate metabolism
LDFEKSLVVCDEMGIARCHRGYIRHVVVFSKVVLTETPHDAQMVQFV